VGHLAPPHISAGVALLTTFFPGCATELEEMGGKAAKIFILCGKRNGKAQRRVGRWKLRGGG
jgi:hypothetical protein